jgi:rod shape-determining protein MreC
MIWNPIELLTRLLALLDRHRGASVLFGSVLLSLLLFAKGESLGPPLRRLSDLAIGPVQALTSSTLALLNVWVWKENADLQARLLVERTDRVALEELRLENSRLRSLLAFPAPGGFRTIPCSVIGLVAEPFGASLTIDRGRSAGLSGGEAVVSVDGLVGRVVEVSGGTSRVRMVNHYEAPVGVRVQRNRVAGVMEWDPSAGRLSMRNVPATEEVAEGDTLVTSGLGGVYPEGLYVGRVAAVHLDPMGIVHDIAVTPGARFHRLEELFVLKPLLPSASPLVPRPFPLSPSTTTPPAFSPADPAAETPASADSATTTSPSPGRP